MRIAVLAVGAIICAGAYTALTRTSVSSNRDKSNVVDIRVGDAAVAKARAEAQATLATFLQRARNPQPGQGNFSVKVGIGGQTGPKEFVWLTQFRLDGETGSGTLNNVPRNTPDYKIGQTVTFARAEVTDWTYRDGRSLKGNFSGCAILSISPEPEKQRAQFLEVGLDCSKPRV